MIPVLITSIVNRPDLLDRMFDTLDVPVGRALVVDNGHVGYQREGVTVCEPPFESLGWPGSLNFGIMQTPEAPWWLFVNNDAYFEPGSLARLVDRMQDAGGVPRLVTDGYTVGGLNRAMVELVGLFDEWSYFPIYFDDTDYSRRAALSGYPVEHGHYCLEGDIGEVDVPSLTTKSDPVLSAANNRTWALNEAAYVAKWGGLPGAERFTVPWDRPGTPLWATHPDPRGRMLRTWPATSR